MLSFGAKISICQFFCGVALIIASLIVLHKAVRVNTFRIVKEQTSAMLFIGCLFVIFSLL